MYTYKVIENNCSFNIQLLLGCYYMQLLVGMNPTREHANITNNLLFFAKKFSTKRHENLRPELATNLTFYDIITS